MIQQIEFLLTAKPRGCHLVTEEILSHLPKELPQTGLINIFVQHTSCGITINENADPDVRSDMEKIMSRLVIPITHGKLNLGTWQGIYLCEFRNYGGRRNIVATIYG